MQISADSLLKRNLNLVATKPTKQPYVSSCTVTVKHNGVNLTFDFAKVYFNPRLGTEHSRVTSQVEKGDVMLDVFAGVGPFSVACAR